VKQTWATSGIDLLLDVSGTRIRASLESVLRGAISEGRLAVGTRLPSSRSLAADLGVARNTVAEAYVQLVAEGWLDSRSGSGTWVAQRPAPTAELLPRQAPTAVPARYDLRPGVPDLSSFPRSAWIQSTKKVLASARDDMFGYADPRGLLELRTALAGYLSRARHVVVNPTNIVICAGISHGLSLVCQTIKTRGANSIAVEGYGYHELWRIPEAAGLRVIAMPVDDKGADVGRCAEAGGAMLTPNHQFPWGVSLHPSRRRSILEWAVDGSAIVLEDDYDGEFRYDRQPVGALQALAPHHLVYVGTASKSLAPGLRLGWLVVPDHLLEEVVEAKRNMGAACSSLDQLVLAALIASGTYDRLVRRARLHYQRRRALLVATLHERASTVSIQGAAAGLQALVLLRPGQTEAEVVNRGLEAGLALQGLDTYTFPGQSGPPALVVGFARPPDHAFGAALDNLCTALS
jgi:GntR family transcriptional regulator / MocR family aminotransferase